MVKQGEIIYINGPVVRANQMTGFIMQELVYVGQERLIGEIIEGEPVYSTGGPLSVKLGPGIIGNIFDGIQRPLPELARRLGSFISRGEEVDALDREKQWEIRIKVNEGEIISSGQVIAELEETSIITHRITVPPGVKGEVKRVVSDGSYTVEQEIVRLINDQKREIGLKLYQEWPIRQPRPYQERLPITRPLLTGQRVFDTFFPLGKGGTAAIPGGFGAGKTMTQHQLAKWSDADIIIYVGCGERGNEMTDVLEEFPGLVDPRTGRSMMERTVLIANTSNMPVAAREASIYTGITIAEYYRDMGYNVALMADSTSRWAEALREISGRLEEMPAEEGFPAYLPSRLAEFYERAGNIKTLGQEREGSISIIGAVSPPGGDFSEPVTQNTKRFVRCFWALDKTLASARHFPAVSWLDSYSEYIDDLEPWLKENIDEEWLDYRKQAMEILKEEARLQEIVKLVGEDVLPNSQRLILEVARLFKIGFLQQNAFSEVDRYAVTERQFWMLKVILSFYEQARPLIRKNIPISRIRNDELFSQIIKMKENIANDELDKFQLLIDKIKDYFNKLLKEYQK